MLRLKINLRVRRSVRVKCPRHPRYNQERDRRCPYPSRIGDIPKNR